MNKKAQNKAIKKIKQTILKIEEYPIASKIIMLQSTIIRQIAKIAKINNNEKRAKRKKIS